MSKQPSPQELEKMADAILQEDAKRQGFVKNAYGFGNYAKQYGILTKHDIATIRIYERSGDPENVRRHDEDDS